MQRKNPNYYAILPAPVRYDTELTANEKILYSELSALSESNGYCWPSNKYFAELYNVSKETVSRWISHLKKCGYIEILERDDDEKQRYISINSIISTNERSIPLDKNVNTPLDKNVNPYIKDQYKIINNIKGIDFPEGFSEEMKNTVSDWIAYKKERREEYKPRGLKALLTQIKEAVSEYGERAVIKIIEKTMSSNYQGIVWDWFTKAEIADELIAEPKTLPEHLINKENYDWLGDS